MMSMQEQDHQQYGFDLSTIKTKEQKEAERGQIIARNVRILEAQCWPDAPDLPEEEAHLKGTVGGGDRYSENGVVFTSLWLTYNTKTGALEYIPDVDDVLTPVTDGHYSKLHTYLVTENEKIVQRKNRWGKPVGWKHIGGIYTILTHTPTDWLTDHAASAAIAQRYGDGDGIDPYKADKNRILPQRQIVQMLREYGGRVQGVTERIDRSQFVSDPKDSVLIESINAFNKKHSRPIEQELFRGMETRVGKPTIKERITTKFSQLFSRVRSLFSRG